MMKRILALAVLVLAGCATVSVVERPAAVLPAATQQSASAVAPGVVAVAPGVVAVAQTLAVQETSPQLTIGEKLTYDVRWVGLSFGTITASVLGEEFLNGRKVYVLEAIVKSKIIVSLLTNPENRFVSYMDAETFCSLRQEVYEGSGVREKKVSVLEFDQVGHRATYRDLARGTQKSFDMPPRAQDPLTLCYFFRTVPLAPGAEFVYGVERGSGNRDALGLVTSEATVRSSAWGDREKEAFLLYPFAEKKKDKVDKGRVRAYYSRDGMQTPLLAFVKVPFFNEVMVTLIAQEKGHAPSTALAAEPVRS